MKYRYGLVLCVGLILAAGPAFGAQVENLPEAKVVDSVGQSALLEAGPTRILLLQGTAYQVGYAHGRLLAKDIKQLVDRILLVARSADPALKDTGAGNSLEEIHRRTLPYIPARYREELAGLADGAGIDRYQIELANLLPEMFHCSGFALMGKATKTAKLIHGRVLDYMTEIGLQDHAVMLVTRISGCNDTMIASYAGFIGCVTGLNDKQIAIGEMGMQGFGDWDGLPMSYMLRQALEDFDTVDQILRFFHRSTRTCEYAYIVSDAKVPTAAAIYANPEGLNVLSPGQAHQLLPKAVADSVIVSAGQRYDLLIDRVREAFGNIDVSAAVEIMKRPVAMDGNLHSAVMLPQDGIIYLANAAAANQENFQACYQTYYKYQLSQFEPLLNKLAEEHGPTQPKRMPLGKPAPASQSTSQPTPQTQPSSRPSTTTSSRPVKSSDDPHLIQLLQTYNVELQPFEWQMAPLERWNDYTLWQVTFPSACASDDPENNTVWCEYFQSSQAGARPAVIVLNPFEEDYRLPRMICQYLTVAGVDTLLMKMPYCGPRRPADPGRRKELLSDLDRLVAAVHQSVMDVRRSARFLADLPNVDKDRIGILGVSLGAVVGALAVGVDAGFSKAVLVLGGGDLAGMIEAGSDPVKPIVDYLKAHGIDETQLRAKLELIEPLTFASRARETQVLMINARRDKLVPAQCAEKLAAALAKSQLVWYDADQTSILGYLFDALVRTQQFFKN